MGFTFAARSILELGKELISSDEVAIYELVKNAVDAGSPQVQLTANIHLLRSDLEKCVSLIEHGGSRKDALNHVRGKLLNTDAAVVDDLLLRLERLRNPRAFISALRTFYVDENYVEIRDQGHGMTLEDLSEIFLRIGTNSRRKHNRRGAKHLGDKGIGRLSAMRIGDLLSVTTSSQEDSCWNILDIDWSWFDDDGDTDAADYDITPERGDKKADPNESGTAIRIAALHDDWTYPRFAEILQGKIARMLDPFEPGSANSLIVARHNGVRVLVPSIPTKLLDAAHAVCHAEFNVQDGMPTLKGVIDYRLRHRKQLLDLVGPELRSMTKRTRKRRAKRGHAAQQALALDVNVLEQLGPFSFDVYWFNRRILTAIEDFTELRNDTRREISHWSGGPMLYRYGFRVLPYGEPDDDWLGLDKLAFGQRGFKLNRQQVIGRVRVDTPHHVLSEQTNRQGLIENDASHALRSILQWILHVEFRELINDADEAEKETAKRLDDADVQVLRDAHARVEASLARVRLQYADTIDSKELEGLGRSVQRLTAISEGFFTRVEEVKEAAANERGQLVYLAGIGLMTEFIFHELERAMTYTIGHVFGPDRQSNAPRMLKDQLVTLQKRISAFDELTTERRQSKTTFDVIELVEEVLAAHQNEFERHAIEVAFGRPKRPFRIKAVRGMVIQILENLIVNSAYWLKEQAEFDIEFEPAIFITIDPTERRLTVEDNGPGVSDDRRERIFQPFVTTKPVGMGRGLGLYIARDMAEYHDWTLAMDPELGRFRKDRTNLFVLDLDP